MIEALKLVLLTVGSGIALWCLLVAPVFVAGLVGEYHDKFKFANYLYTLFWKHEHKLKDLHGRLLGGLAALVMLLSLYIVHLHYGLLLVLVNFIFSMLLAGTAVMIFFYMEDKHQAQS